MNTNSLYIDALIKHAFNWGTPLRYAATKARSLLPGDSFRSLRHNIKVQGMRQSKRLDNLQGSTNKFGRGLGEDWGQLSNAQRLAIGGVGAGGLVGAGALVGNREQAPRYMSSPSRQGFSRDELIDFIQRNGRM